MDNSHAQKSIVDYVINFNKEVRLLSHRDLFLTESDLIFMSAVITTAISILLFAATESHFSAFSNVFILVSAAFAICYSIVISVKATQERIKVNVIRALTIVVATTIAVAILMQVIHWLTAIAIPCVAVATLMAESEY